MGIVGAVLGLALGLTSTRVYKSEATFIPQGADQSGASALATQFGIRMPTTSGGWGPAVYVELMHSRALLEPLASTPVVVAEEGNRRVTLMDLLRISGPTPQERLDYTVQRLEQLVQVSEDKRLAAVRVSVVTPWPSVSLALVKEAVDGVTNFNLQTRKSQAAAERQFAENQAAEAERALRDAENRSQDFLQRNRTIAGSPELMFERDRLQREVTLRQSVYTSLLQNREEARLREVRDTPVITVIESPRLAVVGEPRKSVKKALVGGMTWALLGVLIALLIEGFSALRRTRSKESREFFQLVEEATPRFLRKLR
jgi:uncharacterized protein involved in exopolysaccharide biosynthesis